jgi:hypothetical protein
MIYLLFVFSQQKESVRIFLMSGQFKYNCGPTTLTINWRKLLSLTNQNTCEEQTCRPSKGCLVNCNRWHCYKFSGPKTCYWNSTCSGTLRPVDSEIFTNVSEDRSAFIFRIKPYHKYEGRNVGIFNN